MLLYVGLSIVSITINLCAQSLLTQMKKTGFYLKIVQLFSSQGDSTENNGAHTQGEEGANAENRRPGLGERIAMSDLEERHNADIEDDNQAARMNIVRDANGKRYGTVQE